MVIEKSKRLVEHGRDVVILLDSITRLAGRITCGAALGQDPLRRVDANALQKPNASSARHGTSTRAAASASSPRLDRHRQPDGRGDLRGVQGHRQLGAGARSPAGGPADLPAIDIQRTSTRKEELSWTRTSSTGSTCCATSWRTCAGRGAGVPARADEADQEQQGVLRHMAQ